MDDREVRQGRSMPWRAPKWLLAAGSLALVVWIAAAALAATSSRTREAAADGLELDRLATVESALRSVPSAAPPTPDEMRALAGTVSDPDLVAALEEVADLVEAGDDPGELLVATLASTGNRITSLRRDLGTAAGSSLTVALVGLLVALLAAPALVVTAFHRMAKPRALALPAPTPMPALPSPAAPARALPVAPVGLEPVDEDAVQAVLGAVVGQLANDDVVVTIAPDGDPSVALQAVDHVTATCDLASALEQAVDGRDRVVVDEAASVEVIADRTLLLDVCSSIVEAMLLATEGTVGVFTATSDQRAEVTFGAPSAPRSSDAALVDLVAGLAQPGPGWSVRCERLEEALFVSLTFATGAPAVQAAP